MFDATVSTPARAAAADARRRGSATSLTVVLLVVALAITVAGFLMSRSSDAKSASAGAADLHLVEPTSFDISVIASGELEAQQQTEIRSRVEGQATITYVAPEGSRVQEGDLLVEFNADEIEAEIEEDQLQVESSRSELIAAENALEIQKSENEAALRQARLKVELAELELKKWEEGDLIKRRQELYLDIEKAERNLELYEEQYNQTKDLYERGFESKDTLKSDEIRFIEAQAEIKRARLAQEVFEEYEYVQTQKQLTSDVEEARAELERVKQQNASRLASAEADRTNRRRQLSIREERLAEEQRQLEATKMYAPTDGLVVYATSVGDERGRSMGGDGPLQIGRTVRNNELLIILPDTRKMRASVRVHESNAGRVEPGQEATVKIDALSNRVFHGEVESISVLAASGGWRDPNLREYTVKVLLEGENADRELKPGMRADADIRIGRVENALTVPAQAVFREGEIAYVYVKRGSKYARKPVKLGRRSSTQAEITLGLEGGEQVLLREPRPGEAIDEPFSEEQLAQFGPSEEELRERQRPRVVNADARRPGGAPGGRGGFDMTAMLKPYAGRKIDEIDFSAAGIPDRMVDRVKEGLKQRYPDGVIPEDIGQESDDSADAVSAAAGRDAPAGD